MAGQEAIATAAAEVVIERVFDAPRELVWRAWTDPSHLAQWWAADGAGTSRCSVDLRTGGRLVVRPSSQEQGEAYTAGVFLEVDPPHRLVYGDCVTNPWGENVIPLTRVTSVTFEDLGNGRTKMTLR